MPDSNPETAEQQSDTLPMSHHFSFFKRILAAEDSHLLYLWHKSLQREVKWKFNIWTIKDLTATGAEHRILLHCVPLIDGVENFQLYKILQRHESCRHFHFITPTIVPRQNGTYRAESPELQLTVYGHTCPNRIGTHNRPKSTSSHSRMSQAITTEFNLIEKISQS